MNRCQGVILSALSIGTVLLSGQATAAKYTNHRYFWSNLLETGDFNDLGNWADEVVSESSSKPPYYFFPAQGSGGTVKLSEDFACRYLVFTNAANAGTTTLDFDGHTISMPERWSNTYYRNKSPVVLTNGTLVLTGTQRSGIFGLEDGSIPELRFENMTLSANEFASGYLPNLTGPYKCYFRNSTVTNFPTAAATCSNVELTYDNTFNFSATKLGMLADATNVTISLVNGTRWNTGNNAQNWIKTGPGNADCRFVFGPGTLSNSQKVVLEGTNNTFAATNTTIPQISLSGYGNRAVIDNVALECTPAAGSGMSLNGTNNTITASGILDDINMVRAWYGNGSKNARIEFCDNTVLTNHASFRPYFQRASEPVFWVGTNCQIRFSGFQMNSANQVAAWNGMDSTNALIHIGKGSKVANNNISLPDNCTAFNGYNALVELDNGQYLYEGFKGTTAIYCGVTIAMNGDDSAFRIVGEPISNPGGSCPLHCGLKGGNHDLPTVLSFKPGPQGYHGIAPFSVKTLSASYMTSNTVIKVDLSEFTQGKTSLRHIIPLIKGNPSRWSTPKPDVDWLTENLTVEPAGRIANAKIVYDESLDAISLSFSIKRGLVILFR